MTRTEYLSLAITLAVTKNNNKCLLSILNQISDLSRVVDITERRLKIPRHVAARTIKQLYLEEHTN